MIRIPQTSTCAPPKYSHFAVRGLTPHAPQHVNTPIRLGSCVQKANHKGLPESQHQSTLKSNKNMSIDNCRRFAIGWLPNCWCRHRNRQLPAQREGMDLLDIERSSSTVRHVCR